MALKAGHDPNYVAATGALYHTGDPGSPPVSPPTLLGDASAAALLVAGIAAALVTVSKTGQGQVIDASIAESANYLTTYAKSFYQAGQISDQRGARWLDGAAPWNATYATKDDGYMVVAAIEPKFYRSFISGLGLASDPLFADFQQWDQKKWPQQKAAVADRFAAESRTHWTEVFSDLDACVSPVLTYAESAEQVDLTARGANRPIGDQVFPAPAPRFLKTPSSASRSEPADDLAAYLSSIGVSEASLDAWRESLPA
jgi:crotonobetainyl-CoA:carnitine CoA-transferase CaiB-like acyl-CoA transferase